MVTEPTQLSLNPDSFIYSTHQAFAARSQSDGGFRSHLRYEPFLNQSWQVPKNLDFTNFKSLLVHIINHHFQVLPHFQRKEQLNIDNIAWFSQSVATLFADIEYLLSAFTGRKLPKFKGSSLPKVTHSKHIILVIKKHFESVKNFQENQLETSLTPSPCSLEIDETFEHFYAQELWSLIASFAKKTFGDYFYLISTYAVWKFSIQETQQESIDWNVRPPCGAVYQNQFKELFEKERQERFLKRNDKNSKGNKTKNFQQNEENQEQKYLEFALKETKSAIQKMTKNKTIFEFNLAPQNSFVRRQQHNVATEAGFDTESRGESRGRYVCIRRKA
jgi:hypothetical protein